jgi:ligand-binding sensor domain-containing protein
MKRSAILCTPFTSQRDSTLLIGTAYRGSGLFIYDRKQRRLAGLNKYLITRLFFDIHEDDEGNIWTGSVSRGAFYYNPKTGKHGNMRFGDTVKNKIINEFAVHDILEDSNHAMWFATDGGGLVKLYPDRKTIKSSLPGTVCPAMLYSVFWRITRNTYG